MRDSSEFSRGDGVRFALAVLSAVPLVVVLFLGLGKASPWIVALVTGIGIVASGYSLARGTESLQFVVSQVLALAFLSVLQVLPEYSIEANLAYHGAFDPTFLHYATASLTGANRLLLGLGWPMVVLVSYVSSRKRGEKGPHFVRLDWSQSTSIFFLIVSTLYSLVIALKASLTVVDAAVLGAIYAGYVWVARKAPPIDAEGASKMEGLSLSIARLPNKTKYLTISGLFALGGFIVAVSSRPFVDSVLDLGRSFGANEYLFIQWLAPFLTEFPEGIASVYWAANARLAPLALANLISSKLNQWTLLMATIPAVFTIALGKFETIQLTGLQVEEILITAAQSLYGAACVLDMKLEIREGGLLLTLFLVQFFVPAIRLEVAAAYSFLTAFVLVRTRKNIILFSNLRDVFKGRSS